MADRPRSGSLLGIPYNFEPPRISRLFSAYWQPDEGMLVEKPFGIGYTLNLANWRSWLVLAAAGVLLWQERRSEAEPYPDASDEPVEVVVDD